MHQINIRAQRCPYCCLLLNNAHVKTQVRDRATLYLEQLEGRAGGFDAITVDAQLSAKNLEAALLKYLDGPLDAPFDAVRVAATMRGPGRFGARDLGKESGVGLFVRAARGRCFVGGGGEGAGSEPAESPHGILLGRSTVCDHATSPCLCRELSGCRHAIM